MVKSESQLKPESIDPKKALEGYYLWGEQLDMHKAARLHLLTTRWRDTLLTDHELQNLLLNDGYDISEERRPTSYLHLGDQTFNRKKLLLHLGVLEAMVNRVTRPFIVTATQPEAGKIVGPDAPVVLPDFEYGKGSGYNEAALEQLQRDWFEHPHLSTDVRALQKALNTAFDVYNLKFILNRFPHTSHIILHFPSRENALQDDLKSAYDRESITALDSAYYERANSLLRRVAVPWEKLQRYPEGKMFTVSPEDEPKLLAQVLSGYKI